MKLRALREGQLASRRYSRCLRPLATELAARDERGLRVTDSYACVEGNGAGDTPRLAALSAHDGVQSERSARPQRALNGAHSNRSAR